MESQPRRSLFLELPREVRNLIYEHAIMSCTAVEDVKDHTATDRPLFSTVTKNVHPRLPLSTCLRFRLSKEGAQDKLHRQASPGGVLLANRQLNAEFTHEMFLRCKLVGLYRITWDRDNPLGFKCNACALIHHSLHPSSTSTTLPLHHVRHYEVQFDAFTFSKTVDDPAAGHPDVWTRYLDRALVLLPSVTDLTLRLNGGTLSDYRQFHQAGTTKPVILPRPFLHAQLPAARSVRVFKKVFTIGIGIADFFGDGEPSTATQVFPMYETVEAYDDATGSFTVASEVALDPEYGTFYILSQLNGYYWVHKQYHASLSDGEGSPLVTYRATLDTVMAGYRKWVANGKPSWCDSKEHREIVGRLGPAPPELTEARRIAVKEVGRRLGY